jgi:hypothetical protein
MGIVPMWRNLVLALGDLIFRRPQATQRRSPDAEADGIAARLDHHLSKLAKPVGRGAESSGAAVELTGGGTMNAAYEKLIQHLDEHNVRYLTSTDNRSICADFSGEVGMYRIVATVDAEDSLFQVFGHSPVRVPKGSRSAVAQTLIRANYGLKVGKFEMDYDDGDLRFQVAQILPDDNLEDETIRRLLGTVIAMLNSYLPAILSVIYGNELPEDAILCVEGRKPSADESAADEPAS